MFAGVLAAGDAEAKVEVKTFEELVAKVVPLNHAEVVDRFISHCELHPERSEGVGLSLALKSASKAQDRHHPQKRGSVRTQEGLIPTLTLTPSPCPPLQLPPPPPPPHPQPSSDLRGSHLPQAEEGRCELVADKASSIGVQISPVDGQPLCNVPRLGLSGLQAGAHAHPGFHPRAHICLNS